MAETPAAGWYADPSDPARLRYWNGATWTGETRGTDGTPVTEKPRRRLTGLAIAGIVVCSLLTIAGFTAIILKAIDNSTPSPTPTDRESEEPRPVSSYDPILDGGGLPEDWAVYTSRSGSMAYSHDPAWIDLWTAEGEMAMVAATPLAGAEIELGGQWMTDGSVVSGGTVLLVMAVSDGTTVPDNLGLQTMSFVTSNVRAVESDEHEELYSEGFTTAQGYDAWRIDYTMDAYGMPFYSSVIALRHDVTLAFIYVVSDQEFEEWVPGFLTLVDSLEIVHPPTSP